MTQRPFTPPRATSPLASPWEAGSASLLPQVRQALAAAPDLTAMLLPPLDAHRRRAARLLLRGAARTGDGLALEAASGELLLLCGAPARAERVGAALSDLGIVPGRHWDLAESASPLLDWAARATAPARPDPAVASGIEAAAAAVPLAQVVVRRNLLRVGTGVAPARLARWYAVSRRLLAAALGPLLGAEPDLLDQAAARVEARLAAGPAPPEDEPTAPAPPMLRPGPEPAAPPAPGAIAVLPIAAAADPAALAARRTALREAGWGDVAFDGLDAALLPLIDPVALPGGAPLLLRWSPALGDRAAMAALRGGWDLDRVVLTGCDSAADALAWGLDAGIRRFAGRALEGLMAAARRKPVASPGAA